MAGEIVLARRVRRLLVKVQDLARLFLTGARFEIHDGIPQGASIVAAGMVEGSGLLALGVEHATFDMMRPGTVPPEIPIEFRALKNWRARAEKLELAIRRVLDDPGLMRFCKEEYDDGATLKVIEGILRRAVDVTAPEAVAPLGMIVPGEFLPSGTLLDEDLGVADTGWRDRIPEPWEVDAHGGDETHGGLWMAQNPNDTWIAQLHVVNNVVMVDPTYAGDEYADTLPLERFYAMRTRPITRFGDTAAWPKR